MSSVLKRMTIPFDTVQRNHRANKVRLQELAKTADEKALEAIKEHDEKETVYWQGVSFGIRRALGVLEGRG